MSKQNKTAILRGLAFLLIFLVLFAGVDHVMRPSRSSARGT